VSVVTKDQARGTVREHLDAMNSAVDLVIQDEHTRDEDFGWVFFYQAADYIRSGEFSDQLAGNAPIVVLRETGALHVTGTARPVDDYLEQFRRPT
jgi:hypothetical protein